MTAHDWVVAATNAWMNASGGDRDAAASFVRQANSIACGAIAMDPDLEWARHHVSEVNPETPVIPYPLDEDSVLGIEDSPRIWESPSAEGMKITKIDFSRLEKGIRAYTYPEDHHAQNIKTELPHLMVMSTGRCGTVAMWRLFQRSHYYPYHAYPYTGSPTDRFEMACRYLDADFSDHTADRFYAKSRAAEWLGAIHAGKPMAGFNHLDTIFAPTFAQIHPKSKFIFLRRDPDDVFRSMYGKGQWNTGQLQPVYYRFPFEWKFAGYDAPEQIAWYIRFTETFSRAFGQVMGDRWIELSSDRLFKQNRGEIELLKDFAELDLSVGEIQEHFSRPYNKKAHKELYDAEKGIQSFRGVYGSL